MRALGRPAAIAIGLLALIVPGCSRRPADPLDAPIATVAGKEVRLREFEDYLRANFPDASLVEAPTAEEADRVKSRLFDDFLDERLLLTEGETRGIKVSDDEVDVYLRGADGGPDAPASPTPERREAVRREIVIEKLRESVVRAEVRVSDDDARQYLAEHREVLGDSLELARRELSLMRSHDATEQLLAQLRSRLPVAILKDALPFHYSPAEREATR